MEIQDVNFRTQLLVFNYHNIITLNNKNLIMKDSDIKQIREAILEGKPFTSFF